MGAPQVWRLLFFVPLGGQHHAKPTREKNNRAWSGVHAIAVLHCVPSRPHGCWAPDRRTRLRSVTRAETPRRGMACQPHEPYHAVRHPIDIIPTSTRPGMRCAVCRCQGLRRACPGSRRQETLIMINRCAGFVRGVPCSARLRSTFAGSKQEVRNPRSAHMTDRETPPSQAAGGGNPCPSLKVGRSAGQGKNRAFDERGAIFCLLSSGRRRRARDDHPRRRSAHGRTARTRWAKKPGPRAIGTTAASSLLVCGRAEQGGGQSPARRRCADIPRVAARTYGSLGPPPSNGTQTKLAAGAGGGVFFFATCTRCGQLAMGDPEARLPG